MPTGLWLVAYGALWLVLLINSILLVGVIRHVAHLHSYRVQNDPEWGLPLESLAPALPPEDLFGRPVSLAPSRGRKTLLYFVSAHCSSCRQAMARVPLLSQTDGLELVLVVSAR